MSNITQTVSIPPYRGNLSEWFKSALVLSDRVEALIEVGEWFAKRAEYDLRRFEVDEEGFNTSRRVDGTFLESHPLRRILWNGSEYERVKGLFVDDRKEDDNTKFTAIRPFSQSIVFHEPLPIPNDCGFWMVNGHTNSSPSDLPYQRLIEALEIQPLARVFSIQGAQGEGGSYFFPMSWGDQKDLYFVVEINARYGDLLYYFFQGNPEDSGALSVRRPRSHEIEAYFTSRGPNAENGWGARECPSLVPITYQVGTEQPWVNPQPIELRDLFKANNTLKTLLDESGLSPYISSNS